MTSYLDDDDDDYPVRDHNFSGIAPKKAKQDDSVQKTFLKLDMLSKLGRNELEDKYLRLYEDHLTLKKHCRKQEEYIKKMATKQMRLVNDKKKLLQDPSGKVIHDVQMDDELESVKQRVHELERQNGALKLKLMAAKQEIYGNQGGRTAAVYSHVLARIDTGIPKIETRISKSMRTIGPGSYRQKAPRGFSFPDSQQNSQMELQNRHLETINEGLQDRVNNMDAQIENLKDELRIRESEFTGELAKTRQKFGEDQRVTVQDNIERIRLERELKEKSSSLTQIHAQYENLEEKLHVMKTSHDRVLQEMERLNEQLKHEQNRVLSLQSQIKSSTPLQRQLTQSEERIGVLQKECQILKEANTQLVSSAFDLEKEREWRQRENYLKVQIAQLEATLRADVGEKGGVLDKLNEEREKHDQLDSEHRELRVKYFEIKQKHDSVIDQMSFFSKDSAINQQEIEEALVIVKQRQMSKNPELEFLQRVDEEHNKDLDKVVKQLQAEHAETINELEKTRNMLIVQHKINKDYQMEVDLVSKKLEESEKEYKTRLDEYAQLLDIRAARIRKLEAQMKDVAYGTRQYRIKPEDTIEDDDLEGTVELELGQNLFEIHVSRVILSNDGLKQMGDDEPNIFCTWEFYEFEIQSTPIRRGQKIDYDFTSQYIVQVDDFFLHYLQKDSCVLELHQSFGTDYQTVAVCHLKMHDILEKSQGRLHGSVHLTGVRDNDSCVSYGIVEYWVRLRVPMEQALRLYKERSKAMGYLESNLLKTDQPALVPLDETARIRAPDNINQLSIHIIHCTNVESHRKDIQPSPYCIYKFFDFPDHDTRIVACSNCPQFNDEKIFPVDMTSDLDKYLKSQMLKVYVFDDTDPDTMSYLGVADIPLIPLSHDKHISGSFALHKPDGTKTGTMDIVLSWQYTYLPPKSFISTKPKSSTEMESSVSMLPGEEEDIHQSTVLESPRRKMKPSTSTSTHKHEIKSSAKHPSSVTSPHLTPTPPSGSPRRSSQLGTSVKKGSTDVTFQDEELKRSQAIPVAVSVVKTTSDEDEEMLTPTNSQSPKSPQGPAIVINGQSNEEPIEDEEEDSLIDKSEEELQSEGENQTSSRNSQTSVRSVDSDVVVPSRQTPKNETSKMNGKDASDVVKVVVSHVVFDEGCPILMNPNIRMLFVEYRFLGEPLEETETPYSLPKPTIPNKPISFNFTKVFHVDFEKHYERRQYLGSMLLPTDPDNGRIRFTIVSEPQDEDEDSDCMDVGVSFVSIREILEKGSDIINKDVPILDVTDESTRIGSLRVTVECLAALQVINRQIGMETVGSTY